MAWYALRRTPVRLQPLNNAQSPRSMLLFVASILSFVWRTGSTLDPAIPPPLPPNVELAPRIIITGVFGIGLVYFALIVKTLKRYGDLGERELQRGRGVGPGNPLRDAQYGLRASEVDAAMERRGRDRQRRGARGVRKREEGVERRDLEGAGEAGGGKVGESGLGVGLGLTGMGGGLHGGELVDEVPEELEKGGKDARRAAEGISGRA